MGHVTVANMVWGRLRRSLSGLFCASSRSATLPSWQELKGVAMTATNEGCYFYLRAAARILSYSGTSKLYKA